MKYILLATLLILTFGLNAQTVSGKIADKENGEAMPFALVYVKGSTKGTSSNVYGFYSLTISPEDIKNGKITLVFSFTGYSSFEKEIELSSDVSLNVRLKSSSTTLTEFTVEADRTKEIDFVARKKGEILYVQVCYVLNEQKTINREFGNLQKIKNNFPKIFFANFSD